MQKKSFNFILLFFIPFLSLISTAYAEQSLSTADSLFDQKKYTESFKIYEDILDQKQQASARMLLKMAFIKEGLGDYSTALYYLNLYYLKTSDKNARSKMKDIAEENNLSGFVIDDSAFFLNLLNKYQTPIIISIFLVCLFFLSFILYKKYKTENRPVVSLLFLTAMLVLLFYFINYGTVNNDAIIIENHAYLMSGPSSGSDLIEVIKKGHRVKTFEEHGPWLEILWNGEKAYIKKDKVKKLG